MREGGNNAIDVPTIARQSKKQTIGMVCISFIQDLLDPLLLISVTKFKARYKVEYPPDHSDSVQRTLK